MDTGGRGLKEHLNQWRLRMSEPEGALITLLLIFVLGVNLLDDHYLTAPPAAPLEYTNAMQKKCKRICSL